MLLQYFFFSFVIQILILYNSRFFASSVNHQNKQLLLLFTSKAAAIYQKNCFYIPAKLLLFTSNFCFYNRSIFLGFFSNRSFSFVILNYYSATFDIAILFFLQPFFPKWTIILYYIKNLNNPNNENNNVI